MNNSLHRWLDQRNSLINKLIRSGVAVVVVPKLSGQLQSFLTEVRNISISIPEIQLLGFYRDLFVCLFFYSVQQNVHV